MTEAIYAKRGRRYVEVGTYSEFRDFYPHGATLVWSRPGSVLTHYRIEPADAALLAAAERMRDAMMDAIRKADRWVPEKGPLKGKQLKAWQAYQAIMGEESSLRLNGASMHGVVDAGIAALMDAVKKGAA